MTTLFSYAGKQNVSLEDALKDCGAALQSPKTYALLYAPNWCKFGLLDGAGIPCGANGNPIELDPVYEARIFNQDAELRWLNEAAGEGKAVLLSEAECKIANYDARDRIEAITTIRQPYLLWGQVAKVMPTTNWSLLTTARIGQLDVPISTVPVEGRVQLVTREYLAVYKEPGEDALPENKRLSRHGNVAVVEERLLALEPESNTAVEKGNKQNGCTTK